MIYEAIQGILIPFAGTTLGAACVFFMKKSLNINAGRILAGFAAGVMTAASVWSLLIPAIEQSAAVPGCPAFLPPVTGFLLGIAFLFMIDRFVPALNVNDEALGKRSTGMLIFAVTIHNIPEGMAVGAVYAGLLFGDTGISAAAAFALALGIAIQNFPEGAIISMPLHASGTSRTKAFVCGTLSGAVEPIGALLTVAAAGLIIPAMPYFLSFAAGAMIYVAAVELIPEMSAGESSGAGIISYALGFAAMMTLDVALG